MDELAGRLHRSWLELLLASNYVEVAALVVESEFSLVHSGSQGQTLFVDVPPPTYPFVVTEPNIRQLMEVTARAVAKGYFYDEFGNILEADALKIEFRVKLIDVEEGWRDKIKELISNAKDSNQGVVTEKVFAREKKRTLLYNEMKFGSHAEVRIAQELERRSILFFPLPLAVRSETGRDHLDHREPDFLICNDGVWGILEVSNHSPDRYEQDSTKDAWFKKSGILCIEHRTADKCSKQPSDVVDEFLSILAKHKRQ